MNNLRSEFEKLPRIKQSLQDGEIYFDEKEQCYIATDVGFYYDAGYANGAIDAFEQQQKKIDEKQKYIDHLHSLMDEAVLHMQGGSYAEALEILK